MTMCITPNKANGPVPGAILRRRVLGRVSALSTRRPRRAVTLLEMLLAVSLILLTMATLFLFYQISLGAASRAEKYTLRTRQARVVLQQMAREIRQACSGAGEKIVAISGTMHSLTIRASLLPEPDVMKTYGIGDQPPPPMPDNRIVQYYMAVDPDSPDEEGNPDVIGLVRSSERPVDQAVIDESEQTALKQVRMIAPDVKFVRYRYFDGQTWRDAWPGSPGTNGLPLAIKIEIGFAPDMQMLNGEELTDQTDFDLLGNPEGAAPADGRYCLIVRPPMVGLFAGTNNSAGGALGELPDLGEVLE